MKKFELSEFKLLSGANATYFSLDLVEKLMKNQNEIIDAVNTVRLHVYGGIKIEAPNSSG